MGELDEVDRLQDGQTLADRGNTYFFQVFRAYHAQYISGQVMLYN